MGVNRLNNLSNSISSGKPCLDWSTQNTLSGFDIILLWGGRGGTLGSPLTVLHTFSLCNNRGAFNYASHAPN